MAGVEPATKGPMLKQRLALFLGARGNQALRRWPSSRRSQS